MQGKELSAPARDIEVITGEILDLCREAQRTMLLYAVEIGRRLVEAKEVLPHGEWGSWLENRVQFSQSTANKHMKLFEAYGNKQVSLFGAELNSETFTNLSYSQALKLLAVPDEEREGFVKKNDIENKSVREIDRLIRERREAEERAAEAEERAAAARDEAAAMAAALSEAEAAARESEERERTAKENVEELTDRFENLKKSLEKAKAAEKKAKDRIKELKANPEIPEDKIKELQLDAENRAAAAQAAAIESAIADVKAELRAAREERDSAKAAAAEADGRARELEKRAVMADPAVTEFKAYFNQLQETAARTLSKLEEISDEGLKEKFKSALRRLYERYKV